jgi:hypothetical protein
MGRLIERSLAPAARKPVEVEDLITTQNLTAVSLDDDLMLAAQMIAALARSAASTRCCRATKSWAC